ncbi:MAG TPA: nucleotidyltransferase family protein [Candidatus Nitrosotenuis sp.]|jgi:MurNAc alpha-1-phosphate uridylyltransferase|nr:nucleotidyltransferase family protein [Candidatus Nitrosotenuis sp.]
MLIDQAMILAAGFGRRLHPLTQTTPKPLIPVLDKPILAHTLEHLRHGGIKRCVVNTHHLAEQIHNFLEHVHEPEIIISHEPKILETGGGIRQALPAFHHNAFFSVNGDIWWEDQDIFNKLRQFWDPKRMDGILAVVACNQAIDFPGNGDYYISPDQKLRHRGLHHEAPYIYSGIQLLHPRIFHDMPGGAFSLLDLYHHLERRGRLYGLPLEGSWCDIGTPQTLAKLKQHLHS